MRHVQRRLNATRLEHAMAAVLANFPQFEEQLRIARNQKYCRTVSLLDHLECGRANARFRQCYFFVITLSIDKTPTVTNPAYYGALRLAARHDALTRNVCEVFVPIC